MNETVEEAAEVVARLFGWYQSNQSDDLSIVKRRLEVLADVVAWLRKSVDDDLG